MKPSYMAGLLQFASIFLLASEASGTEEIPNPSPVLKVPQDAGIRIPATETPTAEILNELDRSHRAARDEFEKECRRFITRTALDDGLTPEARMKAIEQWFADQAPRIDSLNLLVDYLDTHSPLPDKPARPALVIADDPGSQLAEELRQLGQRYMHGDISLTAFDKARVAAIVRHSQAVINPPRIKFNPPPARETADPHFDYRAHARHLASLTSEEAAAVINNPASPFNRALHSLETALQHGISINPANPK